MIPASTSILEPFIEATSLIVSNIRKGKIIFTNHHGQLETLQTGSETCNSMLA
jgi:hypothetical protein